MAVLQTLSSFKTFFILKIGQETEHTQGSTLKRNGGALREGQGQRKCPHQFRGSLLLVIHQLMTPDLCHLLK